jgi:DNA-directed RNA polymerase subunit E"
MAKEKACKQCKAIYEGAKCPKCGHTEGNEHFTGRVDVIDAGKSELAKKIGVSEKGVYAIRS